VDVGELKMKKYLFICLLVCLSSAVNAIPINFSFTGNLSNDDDVQFFNFSVGGISSVTLQTWSYAGGTNAAGNVISAGGFDPILALFDSAGNLISLNDDGGVGVATDPLTGAAYDTLLTSTLNAGDYIVSVMQFNNLVVGSTLSSGFAGANTVGFVDSTGATRSSFWAFDILNVDVASVPPPVPLPATVWLFFSGLIGLVGMRKKTIKKIPVISH